MFLLSVSTFAGAMVIFTLAAIFIPQPPPALEEDQCGYSFCEVCSADAPLVCTACKTTHFCSKRCQDMGWRNHQRECKIHQKLHEIDTRIAMTRPKRPPEGECTGCNATEDVGRRFAMCKECGYQACGSCESHHSRGTCYCPNSNFGKLYCQMEPRWYHSNGRGRPYMGDRHPDENALGARPYPTEVYERTPRACNSCGTVTRVFTKEFRDPWVW